MSINTNFAPYVSRSQTRIPSIPEFQNSRQFIQDCLAFLREGNSPNQVLGQQGSLIECIFPHFYAGHLDNDLELMLTLVQRLELKGADFKKMVSVDPGRDSWDLSAENATLLHLKSLIKQQNPLVKNIIAVVCKNMEIDDCMFGGHLERACYLLRQV